MLFEQQENQGHIVGKQDNPSGGSEVGGVLEVQCFPLYSYLLALNVTTVDYFSLDVEGAEFSVLKTIPWEKVDIKVSLWGLCIYIRLHIFPFCKHLLVLAFVTEIY